MIVQQMDKGGKHERVLQPALFLVGPLQAAVHDGAHRLHRGGYGGDDAVALADDTFRPHTPVECRQSGLLRPHDLGAG